MSTYLVTMATGQQGGHVVKNLLSAGAKINTVARDPTSESARKLEASGAGNVKLFKGGMTDLKAYSEAAAGASAIFLNMPDPDLTKDTDDQYTTAKNILQVVKSAGVKRVVLSSAMFADRPDTWDNAETERIGMAHYFKTKSRLDDAARESGMDWTILHPAWIMSNYLLPVMPHVYPELKEKAEIAHALAENRTMAHIAEDDIGRYAAAALLNPSKFSSKVVELGGMDHTMEEVAEILSEVSGKPVSTRRRTEEEVDKLFTDPNVPVALPFEIFGSSTDFKASGRPVKEEYGIPLTSLKEYLEKNKERLLASLP